MPPPLSLSLSQPHCQRRGALPVVSQRDIEPMLRDYRVNLAFAGHFHDFQRQSAVYNGRVVQAVSIVYDDEGHEIAWHERPKATVWMVVGAAGRGPSYANKMYPWSEAHWDGVYGYDLLFSLFVCSYLDDSLLCGDSSVICAADTVC